MIKFPIHLWLYTSLGLLLSFALGSASAHAKTGQKTWGFEPTATEMITEKNPQFLITDQDVQNAAEKFAELTKGEIVPNPKLSVLQKYQKVILVKNPYGTWVIHNDHGVLEFASPIIVDDTFDGAMPAVFQTFDAIGLKPDIYSSGQGGGGGHMHVGRNIFDENPKLLRNLLVDMENRPYIQELFEENGDNQALSLRDRGLADEFAKRLAALDARFAAGDTVKVEDIAQEFLSSITPAWKVWAARDLPVSLGSIAFRNLDSRTSAVNLVNIFLNQPPTVEFRFARPPASAIELKNRMLFMERYIDWLSTQDDLIPLQPMTDGEVKTLLSPTLAIQQWNSFVKDQLGLNPSDYANEVSERFPVLAHGGDLSPAGYELEIRPMHSARRDNYEIKMLSNQKPSIEVKYSGQTRTPVFTEAEPGVWIAQVSDKDEIAAMDITVRRGSLINRSLTGSYELWDQLVSNSEHGAFTPWYKSAAGAATPTDCDKLLMKATP